MSNFIVKKVAVLGAGVTENLKYGMVTMCVGCGMGAAGIFERM